MEGKSSRPKVGLRKWVKIHLAVDADTQEIIAEMTTDSDVGLRKLTKALLDKLVCTPKKVLADGVYDKKRSLAEIKKWKAESIILLTRNAKYKKSEDERDRALLKILGLGGNTEARSLWGKLRGYNRRVLVETAFSCLKRLFGERFFSKTIERQQVESRIKCH